MADPTETGPRGGRFYTTQTGKKVYVGEGAMPARARGLRQLGAEQRGSQTETLAKLREATRFGPKKEHVVRFEILPPEKTSEEHVAIARAEIAKHEKALGDFKKNLATLIPPGEASSRVKEVGSALDKLVRKPAYKTVDRLDDNTGGRVIVGSIDEARGAVEKLKKVGGFKIREEENYVDKPPESGYRSFHFTVEHDGLSKEMQIRTLRQDKWATWAHDGLYKPSTAEQKAAMGTSDKPGPLRKDIESFARSVSDHYYAKDSGRSSAMPGCPKGVKAIFDCPPDI